MHGFARWIGLTFLVGIVSAVQGQSGLPYDLPKPFVPKQPPTRQEIEQRASLHLYVHGLLLERDDRFSDALKAFEESARLDPDSPDVIKAQVRILLLVDRLPDAVKACKAVVRLDPGDFAIWYTLAKLHRTLADYPAAIAALERGVRADRLKGNPGAAQQIYFELGSLYEGSDKFALAAQAYHKAAEILEHPDLILEKTPVPREAVEARATETYEKIGALYRKAKKYPEAIAVLRKAQGHVPDRSPRLSYEIAKLYVDENDPREALPHVDVYLRTQPLNIDAYELKIDLLLRLKQEANIVPWLEAAAERDRFNTNLHLLLAKEYARAKQSDRAEKLFTKLVDELPSVEAYRGLFHLYKQEGPEGTLRILTKLNKIMVSRDDPPPPASTTAHGKAMVGALQGDGELARALVDVAFKRSVKDDGLKFETVYVLAILADRHRKNDEAERFYRECLPSATASNEAVIYGGLLRALGRARKNDAIVEVCNAGLKNAKATNPLLFYNDLARAQAGLHRYVEALTTADVGAKSAGDDNQLLFKTLRVRILTMAERFDEAESECQALLKAHARPGESLEVRYLLSNIYSAAKKLTKSEEQLQLILKIDPDNVTVNNDLAYLWADQGKNLAVAEEMIRKALELDRSQRRRSPSYTVEEDKDNSAYVDSLGWVLFRRGQIDEARKELERATTLGDDDPVIYDHLGDVYNRLNMRPEATRAWQRSLELYRQGLRRKDDERLRDIQRKIKEAI